MKKEELLKNIDKIHTTLNGVSRIKKNLNLDVLDIVQYCKTKVLDGNCVIYLKANGNKYNTNICNKIIIIFGKYFFIKSSLLQNKFLLKHIISRLLFISKFIIK